MIQSTATAADVNLLKSSQKNNTKAFKPSHNSKHLLYNSTQQLRVGAEQINGSEPKRNTLFKLKNLASSQNWF